jgi:hypothetical protein
MEWATRMETKRTYLPVGRGVALAAMMDGTMTVGVEKSKEVKRGGTKNLGISLEARAF